MELKKAVNVFNSNLAYLGHMKKLLFLFTFIFALASSSEASHIVSADLTYECTGGLTYEVTLKLYRDCGGLALGPFEVINYRSDSCSTNTNLIMFLDTSYEVSQVCDSLLPSTNCNPSGYLPGIEVYIYTNTITLSGYCPDWRFTYDECCRSTAIDNLSSGFRFFTQTTLNNKGGKCNNSPVFKSIPILYSCANEPINYNNIPIDSEGDSLSFQLVRTKSSASLNIPYSNVAYTAQNPFPTVSGTTFDSITGQMSFISSALQQVIATVLITEYDSAGNVKGTHLRDLEYIIINCPPPPFNPYTSGVNFDTTNYYYKGCYNTPFCFDVFSVTKDTSKPMVLNYYGNIPRATFTTTISNDTTYGQFCWSPDSNDIGNYQFQIEAIADVCPLKRKNIFNYFIEIDTVFNVCVDTNLYLTSTGFIPIDSSFVFDNSASGYCSVQSVHISKDTFTCNDVGTNSVTVTTTYQNGTVKVCTASVTVHDTISPLAACVDTTVYLNSSGIITIDSSYVYDFSIVSCGTASITLSKYSFFCSDLGPNTVELILTENNGFSDTCYGIVTVVDTFLPKALTFDTTVYLDTTGLIIIDSSFVDSGSFDNCAIVKRYLSKDTFNCTEVGPNTIWFYVEDYYGFKDSAQAIITVIDTNKPQAFCQDTTVYLNAGSVLINSSYVKSSTFVTCETLLDSISKSFFTCADTGLNQVTFYVIDTNGNIDSCIANVTVLDTTVSSFICKDTTVYLDLNGSVIIDSSYIFDSIIQNSCNLLGFFLSQDTFNCSDTGVNQVKLYVKNKIGKIDSCTSIVTILDTIHPTAICKDTTVYLTSSGIAVIDSSFIENGSYDNCNIATISLSKDLFDCSNISGSNIVTIVVTDVNGNKDSCSANVTVLDTIKPSLVCQDTSVYINSLGFSIIDTSFVINHLNDACGIHSILLLKDSFDCNSVGLNTVGIIATDINGNIDTCSSLVTVYDTLKPIVNSQNVTIYLDATGNATIDSSMIDNGSADNCGIATMVLSHTNFDCTHIGLNTVTLTVTDVNGNSDTRHALVNVLDTVNPIVICTDTVIYLTALGTYFIDSSYIDNGSSDNCGIASMTLSKSTYSCADVGINSVTLFVTDVNGNVNSCASNVRVIDSVNPIVNCKDDTIYLNSFGNAVINSTTIDNGSSDSCGIATRTVSKANFNCSNIGQNTVTLTVFDNNGNSDSCTSIITVLDTLNPTAICQNIFVYLDTAGSFSIDSSMIDNGSFDNCGIVSMQLSQTTFNCMDIGMNNVDLIVTDSVGNADTCSSIVTVSDTIKPMVICIDTTVYLDAFGKVSIDSSYFNNGSFDNCGIQSIKLSRDSFSCVDVGINTVSIIVTDVNGNIDSCSALVTVSDTIMPVAFAGNDTNICGYLTVNLNAQPGLPHQTAAWSSYISPITPVIGNANSPTSTISSLVKGTHQFVWSVSNGNGCNVVNDTVQIDILDTLFAFTGPDISLCNQYSTPISANTLPNGTTGRWLAGAGTPSIPIIANPILSNTSISNLREGTYPFYWRVSNGLCLDQYDTLIVDVYDLPTSNAGLDQNLCGQYSTALLGNALVGRTKGKWNVLSSPIASPAPVFSNDSHSITNISSLIEGTYQITWTVSSGSCPSAIDTMVINVYDSPIADAGVDTILCSEDSLRLYANNPAGTYTGIWSLDPLVSMAPAPTIVTPVAHNTDIVNMTIGASQQIFWTVSNGTCPDAIDSLLITILARPVVDAGPDTSYCGFYTINLDALPIPQPSVGTWTLDPTSAPNTPVITNKNNPTTTVSGLIEGTYKFIWRGQNLPCYDITDTVTISIFDQHTAYVGADIDLCDQPSTQISGNIVNGTATSRWFLVSSNPNVPSFNAAQASTTLGGLVPGGVYNLAWEISNGICPVSRDTLRVFNQFVPVASFVQDVTEICQNESVTFTSTSTMTLPETVAAEVWEVSGGIFPGPSHTEFFNNPGYHDATLYVVASNGCSDTSFVKDAVFVHTNPIANFSVYKNPEDNYLIQVYITNLAQYSTNYIYKFGDGSSSFLTDPFHQYRDSGTYTIWQIVTNDFGCIDSSSREIYVQQTMAYVPNAFTPNNDDLNDVFTPIVSGNDQSKYRFIILNRWGEEVFNSSLTGEGWDGSHKGIQSPNGTYVWKLIYKEQNGTESVTKTGHINLVR